MFLGVSGGAGTTKLVRRSVMKCLATGEMSRGGLCAVVSEVTEASGLLVVSELPSLEQPEAPGTIRRRLAVTVENGIGNSGREAAFRSSVRC